LGCEATLYITHDSGAGCLLADTSLDRAEEEPVTPGLLQRDEELLTTVNCFLVDVVVALEFGLEGKLAAQGLVSAALTPDADVPVGGDPLAKIQNPEVLSSTMVWFTNSTLSVREVFSASNAGNTRARDAGLVAFVAVWSRSNRSDEPSNATYGQLTFARG
jgi:hypothetical protein